MPQRGVVWGAASRGWELLPSHPPPRVLQRDWKKPKQGTTDVRARPEEQSGEWPRHRAPCKQPTPHGSPEPGLCRGLPPAHSVPSLKVLAPFPPLSRFPHLCPSLSLPIHSRSPSVHLGPQRPTPTPALKPIPRPCNAPQLARPRLSSHVHGSCSPTHPPSILTLELQDFEVLFFSRSASTSLSTVE